MLERNGSIRVDEYSVTTHSEVQKLSSSLSQQLGIPEMHSCISFSIECKLGSNDEPI